MTPLQTWIVVVGIGAVGFCAVVLVLAVLAWVAGFVERRHVRRHARRRGGMLGEAVAGFPRSEP